MSTFPIGIPVPVSTGNVRINGNIAVYQLAQGVIKFDITRNPVQVIDGEMRQALMQSTDGEWYLETNSGGINFMVIRLFHQTYLTKLPPGHELIPSDKRLG